MITALLIVFGVFALSLVLALIINWRIRIGEDVESNHHVF